MIVFFAMTLIVLLITAAVTSYLDPSDPLIRQYIENNEKLYILV